MGLKMYFKLLSLKDNYDLVDRYGISVSKMTMDMFHRRVPLVEQELLTLPEHLSSPPIFSGVRVTRSLVLYACFVDRCFSFCAFCHCVVCSSSIYRFWLPLWYLQTLLNNLYFYTLFELTKIMKLSKIWISFETADLIMIQFTCMY